MESDDEFGDLYADVLRPISAAPESVPDSLLSHRGDDNNDEDDRILFGPHGSDQSAGPVALPPQTIDPPAEEEEEDGGSRDWLLGRAPPAVETPANWNDEDDGAPARPAAAEDGTPRVLEEDLEGEARASGVPQGAAEIAEAEGFGDADEGGDSFVGSGVGESLGDLDGAPVIPGFSAAADPSGPFLDVGGGDMKPSGSEDWDSDSEDDLQIVLNDNDHRPLGGERNDRTEMEYEDDHEDGEDDLVIVTGEDHHHHHLPVMEEQDWGDEAIQPSKDVEKKEIGDVDKVTGAAGSAPGVRIGFGNHGFRAQHQSMYKYIRPGVSPLPMGPVAAVVGSVDAVRPPPAFGPIAGRGRGDWRPVGVRGISNAPKNIHTGFGNPAWANSSAARAFGSGLEFSLPAHKTVFDIDIESFEEKPWRHPGVDISDFFNFGLDEENWKEYCKELEQLRLESTMRSKICVYESGHSKQGYDPDLPPELAAAAGHDISAYNGQGKVDNGQADFNGQGRAVAIMRAPLPTGRAIQVEGSYGERLPSIDTRPPRMRDSDAIIEIVLQDSMDDMTMSNGALEQADKDLQRDHAEGLHEVEEDDRSVASEFMDRLPHTSSVRKMENTRRAPFSSGEDGILPFPSESPGQDHESSRTRSPIHPRGVSRTQHGARSPQASLHGRHSSSREHSNNAIPSKSADLNGLDGQQQEKLFDSIEVNQSSKVSPAVEDETARHLSTEEKYDKPDGVVALGDGVETEGDNMISDFHKSSEAIGDDKMVHPGNKQNLCSQVDQPAVCISGDEELRTSHSDNSGAKSGSRKDFQKQHDDEVTQGGYLGQTGDLRRPHERENFQRKHNNGRDDREEIDRKPVAYRGRGDTHHSCTHRNWDSVSAHSGRDRSFEKTKDTEASVGSWQRREDNLHNRRVKDEAVRRENSEEIVSRHKSKLRASDKNQRDDLHSRKYMDSEEWRGRNRDETSRKRERDDLLASHRENVDDALTKRKKNEEMRGKTDKKDTMHGHRAREDSNKRKRERDDAIDHRRREDNNRARDKTDAAKHKDDIWQHKEREVRQRLKQPHENAPKHREREEGRGAVRNGLVIEDKPSSGNYKSNDGLKDVGYEINYQDTDRRQQNEQSRRGDRARDENFLQHKGRGDLLAREKQFYNDERSSRHEKLSTYDECHPRASNSQQKYREKHRENAKKGKDTEVHERNSHRLTKRKPENHSAHRNKKVSMTGSDEQESSNVKKEQQQIHKRLESSQLHHTLEQGEEDPASDYDNPHGSRRGRSKLERWTSHKERDYCSIDNMRALSASPTDKEIESISIDVAQADKSTKTGDNKHAGTLDVKDADTGLVVDKTVEDRDPHLDTVAKLRMRSERFKLPMPGERETTLNKKLETEAQLSHSEAVANTEVKPERPARKRKWTGS